MPSDKADTVYRCAGGTLETDLCQFSTNLTASGSGAYETSSTRTALDYTGREITAIFTADTSSSGLIVYRGDTAGSAIDFQVSTNAGSLEVADSTGTIASVAMPSVDGTLRTFNAQICTRANPLTTGASDAYTTEITIECVSPQDWAIYQVHHAASTHTSTDNFCIGGRWDGASLVSTYSDTVTAVRIGSRFKSSTEFKLDASALSDPTPTTTENQAHPIVVMPAASDLGEGGAAAGPVYALAGASVRDAARRLVTPLVNTIFPVPMVQGRTNAIRSTLNSEHDVTVIQGPPASSENPGYGDGPSGFPETARTFDATDKDMFTLSSPPFLSAMQSADHTISAVINWSGSGADGVVCGITGGGTSGTAINDCGVLTVTSGGKLKLSWHHGTGVAASVTSTGTLTGSTWHRVAVTGTVNGANLDVEFWIDGVSDSTGSGTLPTGGGSSKFVIGARDNGGTVSEPFVGSICEIKISNVAMSDQHLEFDGTREQGFMLEQDELVHFQLRQPADGYWPRRSFRNISLGGDTYKLHLDTLVKRPANPMTGKFEARILAGVHFTEPPSSGDSADAVSVAIVAANANPGALSLTPVELVYDTATITGTLERVEFTGLNIPRDKNGDTWFCLASRIGAGSPVQTTGVSFDGLQIIPYSVAPTSDFPLADAP